MLSLEGKYYEPLRSIFPILRNLFNPAMRDVGKRPKSHPWGYLWCLFGGTLKRQVLNTSLWLLGWHGACVALAPSSRAWLKNPEMACRKTARRAGTKKRAQRATSNVFAMFDQDQIQEFKEAFNMIDQNRDGFIDHDDLKDMLASLGKVWLSMYIVRTTVYYTRVKCRHRLNTFEKLGLHRRL